jgi:hypothetical protein
MLAVKGEEFEHGDGDVIHVVMEVLEVWDICCISSSKALENMFNIHILG